MRHLKAADFEGVKRKMQRKIAQYASDRNLNSDQNKTIFAKNIASLIMTKVNQKVTTFSFEKKN